MPDETLKESLATELESVKAVYLNDLELDEPEAAAVAVGEGGDSGDINDEKIVRRFSVKLLPSTADEKAEQFVAMTVRFEVPVKYPEDVPQIELKTTRGLGDDSIAKIKESLTKLAEEKKGNNMLYALIDLAKELLTKFNFPSGKCMICLHEFTKDDMFVKTDCFHHFHCRCLAEYIDYAVKRKEKDKDQSSLEANPDVIKEEASDDASKFVACPVCRIEAPLKELVDGQASDYPPPSLFKKPSLKEETEMLEEAKQQQEKYAKLYEKQQLQGGIIDEEKEKNRLFLRISENSGNSASTNSQEGNSSMKEESVAKSDAEKRSPESKTVITNLNTSSSSSSDRSSNSETSSQNSKVENAELCSQPTGSPKTSSCNNPDSQVNDLSIVSSTSGILAEKQSASENASVDACAAQYKDTGDVSRNPEVGVEASGDPPDVPEDKENTTPEDKSASNSNNASKHSRSGGRRRRQRSRTKSGGQSASSNVKSDGEAAASDSGQQRNSSRQRRRNNSFRRQFPFRGGRGRGRRRARGRGSYGNGGLPSPPFRQNFGEGWNYGGETDGRYRQNGEYDYRTTNGNRDRPGYYAARVFKPAQNKPAVKSDDTDPPSQGNASESSVVQQESNGHLRNESNRRGRRGGYPRSHNRSNRFSENFYQYNEAGGATGGVPANGDPKGRGNYYRNSYRPPNNYYHRNFYDQMHGYYPSYYYDSGYRSSYYGYPNGYGYGRGSGRYNGGGGGGGGGSRRGGYRPRNRSNTNQSQTSKSEQPAHLQQNGSEVVTNETVVSLTDD